MGDVPTTHGHDVTEDLETCCGGPTDNPNRGGMRNLSPALRHCSSGLATIGLGSLT